MRKIAFVFIVLTNVLYGQKDQEFQLLVDSIELKNFRGYTLTVRPSWDMEMPSTYYCSKKPFSPNVVPIKVYKGKPMKKVSKDFVYFNPGQLIINRFGDNANVDERIVDAPNFPNSFRYTVDTNNLFYSYDYSALFFDSIPPTDFSKYFQPFYFKKTEVTNFEYREFVRHVIDSLAKKSLGGKHLIITGKDTLLNWKEKIDWESQDNIEPLIFLFHLETERFYKNKQIDAAKIQYNFNGKSLSIYPDTNSWVKQFNFSFNEPMDKMYFWHPVYDHYPVVGITYEQALAYCHWKKAQIQKEVALQNPNIIIEVDLPSLHEWETSIMESKEFEPNSKYNYVDRNYLTDLRYSNLYWNGDSGAGPEQLRALLYRNGITPGNLVEDGGLHTLPSGYDRWNDRPTMKIYNTNKKGISNMGNNVSEWTSMNYSDWAPLFWKRQQMLQASNTVEEKIISEIERYYDSRNDKNGKMIIGANWSDERISIQLDQAMDGAYAKAFVDPDSAYCTVGFRYVVRVKLNIDTATLLSKGFHFDRPDYSLIKFNSKNYRIQNIDDACKGDEIILVFDPKNANVGNQIEIQSCDLAFVNLNCNTVLQGYRVRYRIMEMSKERIVLKQY